MASCDKNCNCIVFHQETLNLVKTEMRTDEQYQNISNLFKVLSDPTRIKILESIKNHALCVCDLGHLLGVSKSAISHQMKLLKGYQLVQSQRVGKMVYYRLSNPLVEQMIEQSNAQMKGR